MAQYRLAVQTIQRSAGRSAVAAAAYRSGDRLIDERLAMEFDFAAKEDIEFAAIMAPESAPAAFRDRETLWNAAEKADGRKDAVPARELLVSLPHEFDFKQRQELVRDFVSQHVIARGMVADIALHRPGKQGDHRNFHAHILVTTRAVGPQGFGRKPPEWWSPLTVREWRAGWMRNPARMIWAKHAELNAISRARAELRRAELGLRVRQEWTRSPQGQAFIAARRQPGLEQAADVARQRRTLERKIKRADKRIATATRTFNDLRVAQELGQRSLSVPTKSPDETRFIRDVGRPAREALQRFPIPARQQAVERLNKSLGRTIGRGFIPGL